MGRINRISACAILAMLALAAGGETGAAAQGSRVSSPVELARQAELLKPGEWVWAPRIARSGPVLVYVDLSRQIATVYRNGVRIGVTTVSTGKPGHETPTGVFTILQKRREHYSNLYNNAPMPNMQRLTWQGVALHAGNLPGYPASHGCIRMPMAFSTLLFETTTMGGTVVIAGQHGDPAKKPYSGVLAPAASASASPVRPLAPGEAYRWQPQLSPRGPLSIIISKSDQRIVVMRNGVEIGRARATIDDRSPAVQVLTLTADQAGRRTWIHVGVTGNDGAPGAIADTDSVAAMGLDPSFLNGLRSNLTPGATILVTPAPVGATTTGVQTTVIASDS